MPVEEGEGAEPRLEVSLMALCIPHNYEVTKINLEYGVSSRSEICNWNMGITVLFNTTCHNVFRSAQQPDPVKLDFKSVGVNVLMSLSDLDQKQRSNQIDLKAN